MIAITTSSSTSVNPAFRIEEMQLQPRETPYFCRIWGGTHRGEMRKNPLQSRTAPTTFGTVRA
jgi:hypothetical protein